MSNKGININTLDFIEELSDEEITPIIGGAASATPRVTPSSSSILANTKRVNHTLSTSTLKVGLFEPKTATR